MSKAIKRLPVSNQARDWIISAVDPFHDFEHPIEGAPDAAVSKSFTRKFVQTATVSATADDDNITLFFHGSHGGAVHGFYNWGVDYLCDPFVVVPTVMSPIEVLRCPTGVVPSLETCIAGTATSVARFYTCQIIDVPSRLVSLGVEVSDITPSLYRKGSIGVGHANGEVEHGVYRVADTDGGYGHVGFYRCPMNAISLTQVAATPGSYVGPLSKGVYLQGRVNQIKPPHAAKLKYFNGNIMTVHGTAPMLACPHDVAGESVYLAAPAQDPGYVGTWDGWESQSAWSDSGFCPFSVVMTGLAEETVLQITVKTTVEYFPQVTHPFECGLATFSPPYEPEAFRYYHEIMRTLPAAVPVGMNASGDYWKMVLAALDRFVVELGRYGPGVGALITSVAKSAGQPYGVAAGTLLQAAGVAAASRRPTKKKTLKSLKKN
jgi:hypothetical protein